MILAGRGIVVRMRGERAIEGAAEIAVFLNLKRMIEGDRITAISAAPSMARSPRIRIMTPQPASTMRSPMTE